MLFRYVAGEAAPKLIRRPQLSVFKPRSVLVDVSIDQGGIAETSKATTHSEPTYVVDGVNHYCVGNIPGAVPATSTFALTNVTVPYALSLANLGWQEATRQDAALALGCNIVKNTIVHPGVSSTFPDLPSAKLSDVV